MAHHNTPEHKTVTRCGHGSVLPLPHLETSRGLLLASLEEVRGAKVQGPCLEPGLEHPGDSAIEQHLPHQQGKQGPEEAPFTMLALPPKALILVVVMREVVARG